MSRLVLAAISVVIGAALAVGATLAVTSVLAGQHTTPVNKTLYNYGTR